MDALQDTKEYFALQVCVKQFKHISVDMFLFGQTHLYG